MEKRNHLPQEVQQLKTETSSSSSQKLSGLAPAVAVRHCQALSKCHGCLSWGNQLADQATKQAALGEGRARQFPPITPQEVRFNNR